MLVSGSNRRIFGIDSHAGIAVTGFPADGRQIVHRAREEATSYRETYGHHIVPSILANRLSLYVHYFTTHGSLRPFGSSALVAAYDEDLKSPDLYMIEPSGDEFSFLQNMRGRQFFTFYVFKYLGVCFKYFGCAAGKGTQAAKTELEKVLNKAGENGLSAREAVKELAKM